MSVQTVRKAFSRVDYQVSLFTATVVISVILCFSLVCYNLTYSDMIRTLSERVESLHNHLEQQIDMSTFFDINIKQDIQKESYKKSKELFKNARDAAGAMYLYTAKLNSQGEFIYVIDGLDMEASDFRYPGDLIEPEITSDLESALGGEKVMPKDIKDTNWGKIFISYLPMHDGDKIVGVIGIEFEAEHQFFTFSTILALTTLITIVACITTMFFAVKLFRRISNPSYKDMSNSDQLTDFKNRNAFDTDIKNMQNSKQLPGFIVMDLNNLKVVNDSLGHQAGDEYIKLAAEAVKRIAGEGDIMYRVGGDEFVVIMHSPSEKYANEFIKKARTSFEQVTMEKCSFYGKVDMSIAMGWAIEIEDKDEDLHDIYRRADIEMYLDKKRAHEAMGVSEIR